MLLLFIRLTEQEKLSILTLGDLSCIGKLLHSFLATLEKFSKMWRNALRQSGRAVGAVSSSGRVAAVSFP